MKPLIVAVTCAEIPEPDPDEPLLRAALQREGADYRLVAWDGPAFDWSAADLVVPRSTWNYYERPGDFLAWAERVAAQSTLVNPLEVLRWNTHKRYLLELEARGIGVVPTELVARGDTRTLASILEARGWSDVVIKPAVGARSWRNARCRDGALEAGEAHLEELVRERDALVQPYLRSVEEHGERSLIWVDGQMTHSIRKEPRFGDDDECVSEVAMPAPPGARELVESVLSKVDAELLYARVDVVPDAYGRLLVMELELVEPSLFFAQQVASLDRFARALVRRASAPSRRQGGRR